MSKSKITDDLYNRLVKKLNPNNDPRIYCASEVTFDYGTDHAVRVDYMQFKPLNNTVSGIEKGDFYCYEIKSSLEDFHSGHGLNFIGDYNYIVLHEELYESIKSELPYFVGVIVPFDEHGLKSIKKASRHNRTRPLSEMLLMMFRSALRDSMK